MTAPYTLRAWAITMNRTQMRQFEPRSISMGVSPEQQSAAHIWLDARRMETPTSEAFEGGIDIYHDGWIPFTDLIGRDAWSRKFRGEAVS